MGYYRYSNPCNTSRVIYVYKLHIDDQEKMVKVYDSKLDYKVEIPRIKEKYNATKVWIEYMYRDYEVQRSSIYIKR